MRIARTLSLLALLLPLLLSRVPSPTRGHAELAALLVVIVVAIDIANPGAGRFFGWRSLALAAFLSLVLVPPTSASVIGAIPAWSAGLCAVVYVGYYFVPPKSPIPWAGNAQQAISFATFARWAPVVLLCTGAVLLPTVYERIFPPTVTSTWEINEIVGIAGAALWLGALAILISAVATAFRRNIDLADPSSIASFPAPEEPT